MCAVREMFSQCLISFFFVCLFVCARAGHVGSGVVHAGGVAPVPTPAVPARGTSRWPRRAHVAIRPEPSSRTAGWNPRLFRQSTRRRLFPGRRRFAGKTEAPTPKIEFFFVPVQCNKSVEYLYRNWPLAAPPTGHCRKENFLLSFSLPPSCCIIPCQMTLFPSHDSSILLRRAGNAAGCVSVLDNVCVHRHLYS